MKLKTKLLFSHIGIAVLILLVLSFFFSTMFFSDKMLVSQEQMSDRLTMVGNLIGNSSAIDAANLPVNVQVLFNESHWIELGLFEIAGNKILTKTKEFPITSMSQIRPVGLYTSLVKGKSPESVSVDKETKNIWGYSTLKDKGMVLVGYVPANKVHRILYVLIIKLVSAALIIMGVIYLIIQYIASDLTHYLNEVKERMIAFGSGNLKVRIKEIKKNEIGEIASNFNTMAQKIMDTLEAEKELAVLEQELSTATRIQQFLIPNEGLETHYARITGHYEPAAFCGGDWWFYKEVESKLYFIVGDVTGHGTPSAMLTSSCRALVASIFNQKKFPETSEILNQINFAVYESIRGDLNMTMLVCCYDKETKELVYSNASHEEAMTWNLVDGKISRKSIKPLIGIHGPRLGQFPDTVYGSANKKIEQSLRILMYSDGLLDLPDGPQGSLGEGNLIRTLVQVQNQFGGQNTSAMFYKSLKKELDVKRAGQNLIDDLCYVVIDLVV